MTYSKEFIQKTIDVWQPYSPDKLTETDAIEIADNMIGLYTFLLELKKKRDERSKKTVTTAKNKAENGVLHAG